jgi:3-oxoacyl-[acyl-carrier protein] reductase
MSDLAPKTPAGGGSSLGGRVALVTGASRGIGRGIALALAARGADVVVNYRSNDEAARSAVAEIVAMGVRGVAIRGDVSAGSDAVKAMVDEVTESLGSPAILVNNAGITRDNLVMRMRDEEWDAVLQTDLTGAFHLTRACLRGMIRTRWGRVINIGSVIGTMGNPGQANYAAAKAGLAGFTRALAKEVGSRNITVNLVAPGFIETDITAALPEQVVTVIQDQIPLARLGTPSDVAPLVAFLAGDGGAYITGQVIHVDGGLVPA